MRANGTLRYHIYSGNSIDENGVPVTGEVWLSNPIPCSIQELVNEFKEYEDGKRFNLSYRILVERGKVPQGVTMITLERFGTLLGEFQIQGLPTPTTLDRIIIKV